MNLTHLFDLSLIRRRDTVALEFDGREFTFGEIDARSNRLAHLLTRRGLQPGDRLCVYLANCVEMIDLYLACTRLGFNRARSICAGDCRLGRASCSYSSIAPPMSRK